MSTNRGKPRAIILITLDSLRADHVGCYGYPLETTPSLDGLAREAVRFEYTFSPIGLTAPSHASLLTGKYPRSHSIRFRNDKPLDREREVTLSFILKDLGYKTAAFVSILPLVQKLSGLDLGFDFYDDALTEMDPNDPQLFRRRAHQTTTAVLEWIGAHKEEPFFLWVHYSEPHHPYTPPPPYDAEFAGNANYGSPLSLELAHSHEGGIPSNLVLRARRGQDGQLLEYERDFRYYVSQYDGNIRFVDEHFRILTQKLRDWRLYDDSLLLVTADHGEALGENNIYFQHSLTVSLDQIRVPLFMKAPSWMGVKPGTIAVPVTTVDIMPTVLAFCGVEAQYLGLQGLDLSPLLKDDSSPSWPERYIFSEIPAQLSVVSRYFQLLYGKGREASQRDPYPPYVPVTEGTKLFHYIADPRGEKDISASNADIVYRLLTVAEQYLRMPEPKYSEAGNSVLSEEEKADLKERLKQLGYLVEPELEHTMQKETIEAELQQERAERETIKAQLQQVYSSYSWRLTAPIRWAAKIVRKAARVWNTS